MTFDLFCMQIFCLSLLVLVAHFGSKITRRLRIGEVVGQVIGGWWSAQYRCCLSNINFQLIEMPFTRCTFSPSFS